MDSDGGNVWEKKDGVEWVCVVSHLTAQYFNR